MTEGQRLIYATLTTIFAFAAFEFGWWLHEVQYEAPACEIQCPAGWYITGTVDRAERVERPRCVPEPEGW